jgi:uncharacterized damage-inducible protein DinB
MSKSILLKMAQYNVWANNQVIDWLLNLTPAQYTSELISSFTTIEKTTVHIAGAEKIWHERWLGLKEPFLQDNFNGDKQNLFSVWQNASLAIQNYVFKINEEELNNSFSFLRLNGEQLSNSFADSILHVLNHSTYHRGQLVTMLRQVDFKEVSSTDFITFCRLKNS